MGFQVHQIWRFNFKNVFFGEIDFSVHKLKPLKRSTSENMVVIDNILTKFNLIADGDSQEKDRVYVVTQFDDVEEE